MLYVFYVTFVANLFSPYGRANRPGEPLSVPRPNVSSLSKSPLPEGMAEAILYCPRTSKPQDPRG